MSDSRASDGAGKLLPRLTDSGLVCAAALFGAGRGSLSGGRGRWD